MWVFKLLIAIGLVVWGGRGVAQSSEATPLQPSGKWTVQYSDPECYLFRQYGAGTDQVTLVVKPGLLGGEGALQVLHPGKALTHVQGQSAIELEPGGKLAESAFTVWPTKAGARLATYWIEADGMARLVKAESIRVPVENGKSYYLATRRLGAALDTLEICALEQLKRLGVDAVALGIDKASRAKVAIPAIPKFDVAKLITHLDYPREALREKQQGAVGIAWWIDADGKVADCRVLVPSSSALLNRHSCELVRRRARYDPARDAQGNPITSVEATRIIWNLPS